MNRVETRDQTYFSTDGYNKNHDVFNSLLSTLEHLDVN